MHCAPGALLIPPQNSVWHFIPQILHVDNQATELTRHKWLHRLKLWLSSSCDKTVSSINQKGMHQCFAHVSQSRNQTVPWLEGITGPNVAVQKHTPRAQKTARPWKEGVCRELRKGAEQWFCGTGGQQLQYTHAHLICTIYQPSGFHGYPLTCAHLHPKPIKRKYKDKKTMKWT